MLRTKSILAPHEEEDGIRVSVMSRHTLNDGVTPHPSITKDSFDGWMQALAPPPTLIGGYYKRGLSWESFERQYMQFIMCQEQQTIARELAEGSLYRNITLLCVEETPENCHRKILAETCKLLIPSIEIYIA